MRPVDSFVGEFEVLSNFSKLLVPFNVRRERVFYVEVAYQALKATDHAEFLKIIETNDPMAAKRLGRQVDLNPAYWEKVKVGIMYSLLEQKFYANPTMARIITSTGGRKLIEGNYWHDNEWGDCSCDKCRRVKGKNLLGKLLMQIRRELRS